MKMRTNLLPWGALILTLTLFGGWLLDVSEVTAEPPDPFVVNATDDLDDGDCDAVHCSLREAIHAANANSGHDTIIFDLGLITPTIVLSATLPAIVEPTTIDGGAGGSQRVALDGGAAAGDGLTLNSDNSTLRSLVIHSFPGSGVYITGDGNVIEDSYIGVDHSGMVGMGNAGRGVYVDNGANNRIGGPLPGQGNLISGNGSNAIWLNGVDANENVIQGNLIGVDATGMTALRNDGSGIYISYGRDNLIGGAEGTTPGGSCTGACNVVSGNGAPQSTGFTRSGIFIERPQAVGNQIVGNFIGVNVSGTAALPNIYHGVYLNTHTGSGGGGPSNTVIGGTLPAARNLISGNNRIGVYLTAAAANATIQGNFIGTDTTGTVALGNGRHGILMGNVQGIQIGGDEGTTPGGGCTGACNLISGNGVNTNWHGVAAENGPDYVVIQGNFIGVDVAGTQPLGNAGRGISLDAERAPLIGGPTPEARNLVSGNGLGGLYYRDAIIGGTVQNNYFGVDTTGMAAIPNDGGVSLNQCRGCLVTGNVMSGNTDYGLHIISSSMNETDGADIQNNLIGVAADGVTPLGNGGDGVWIQGTNSVNQWTRDIRLGAPGAGNVIAANGGHGVAFLGVRIHVVSVQANFIGADAGGTLNLGNDGDGVHINFTNADSGNGNLIGGPTPAHGNLIVNNAGNGVTVINRAGQTIQNNQIDNNGLLGIDLDNDGVTPNDPDDSDTGANNRQNFPVLTGAYTFNGTTAVTGLLNSSPDALFTIHAYGSPNCDPSGYGEGAYPIGQFELTTDATGAADFYFTFPLAIPAGHAATATAANANGDTSEFSFCQTATTSNGGLGGVISNFESWHEVWLYQQMTAGNQTYWWLVDATAVDETTGAYQFDNLPTGNYAVRFWDPTGHYAHEYFDNVYAFARAQPVAVTDGELTGDINATLELAGQITGTVTLAESGSPLPDIRAVAFFNEGDDEWRLSADALTDIDGNYQITGLTEGNYRVGFFDQGGLYAAIYYSQTIGFDSADLISVTVGSVITNINAELEPLFFNSVISDEMSGFCAGQYDPNTGQLLIRNRRNHPCDFELTIPAGVVTCPEGGTLLSAAVTIGAYFFPLSENPPGSGVFVTHIYLYGDTFGAIGLTWNCSNGGPFDEDLGRVQLFDPSGFITDADTAEPVVGAKVTLFQVPDWRAQTSPADIGTPYTCQSNLSKAASETWSQSAPTQFGVFAAPHSDLISPTVTIQYTNHDGYYGWDVAAGCWYVTVEAEGYYALTSPVVGVPTEVTDLHLQLTPAPTAARLLTLNAHGEGRPLWLWAGLALVVLGLGTAVYARFSNSRAEGRGRL